jgi:antitoxin MazE
MKTKIQKWGNSLAIRIPKLFVESLYVEHNDISNIYLNDKKLAAFPTREYTLEELLSEITEDNVHEEITTGKPVGKEIW